MHGLTPRHRRKAGSGPPASALIAWIGADPHLRNAVAAAASRRRETDLPPPANTRAARAAVIACFVLACGAVLGVTATINDGLLVPFKNSTPAVLGQNNAAAPDQGARSVWPVPVVSPTSVAMTPMMVDPPASQPIPVPPANAHIDHLTPDDPGRPDGNIHSSAPTPPAHSVSPPLTDKSTDSTKPVNTGKSGGGSTPVGSGNLDNPGGPSDPGKPADLAKPTDLAKPANPSNSIGSDVPGDAGKPSDTTKSITRGPTGGTQRGPGNPGISEQSSSPRVSPLSQGSTPGYGPISSHK